MPLKTAVRGRGRLHLIVLLAYLAISLVLTYPLITNFTTHVVGRNIDEATFVWNLWWVKHALLDLKVSPLSTEFIFFPLGISLVYYTLTLFNGLAVLPLTLLTSPIVANNVVYISSLTLSGYGAFLLSRFLLESFAADSADHRLATILIKEGATIALASFAGGLVFAFSSSQFVYASLGQPNLTSTAWIPFFALFFAKTVRESRGGTAAVSWRNCRSPILAGVFLLFAVLTELTYAAFLAIFTAFYLFSVGITALRHGFATGRGGSRTAPTAVNMTATAAIDSGPPSVKQIESRNVFRGNLYSLASLGARLGMMLGVFLVGFSPILVSALREIAEEGEYLSSNWGYADAYSSDLLGYFIPTSLHPLLGDWAEEATRSFTDINIVFVGYVVLALAIAAAIRFWRVLRFWALSALAFLILTLGPILHINGMSTFDFDGLKVNFPLPYILLHYLPLLKATRIPNRFSVMLSLALAVLVAFAVAWLIGKVQSRIVRNGSFVSAGLFAIFSAAILFEHLSLPLPLNNMVASEVYRQIGADSGDFAIMQLPLGWRNSYGMLGAERTIIQSYQTVHQKRMLGGNISRNPDFKFAYFAQTPFLRTIAALEEGKPLAGQTRERDARLASEIVRLYNVRYVVVHREYVKPEVEDYVEKALTLEKFYDRDGVAGYRLPAYASLADENIDFGRDDSAANRGEGWSSNESLAGEISVNWATRQQARVFFSAYGGRDVRLKLRMIPFVYPGMPEQTALATVNGKDVGELKLKAEWAEYQIDVPASGLREGLNELTVRFAHIASPSKALPGSYEIGGTKVRSPVDVTIQSAGMSAGNYAYIKVNGKDAGKNGRGYNLVAIDPKSGKLLQSASFDTFASEADSERLAEAIESLPAGTIVALAAKDDASQKLTARAWQAIQGLGGTTDLRGRFRWSHSLLGVKGARPGEAAEVSSEQQQAYVHVGANPDTRTLAAAVDYVRVESK